MAFEGLQEKQNKIRQFVGKAVFRLNTQGLGISFYSIIDTLKQFIEETDNRTTQLLLTECIDTLILTNGDFLITEEHQQHA